MTNGILIQNERKKTKSLRGKENTLSSMKQPLPVAQACFQITLDPGKKQKESACIKSVVLFDWARVRSLVKRRAGWNASHASIAQLAFVELQDDHGTLESDVYEYLRGGLFG